MKTVLFIEVLGVYGIKEAEVDKLWEGWLELYGDERDQESYLKASERRNRGALKMT